MFDKQEIAVLKDMFATQRVDMREETRALIAASENRLEKSLGAKIEKSKIEIIEFIDETILPQIADLQRDNVMIKQYLKLA